VYKQSVFVEITNPVHGGNGWEFGNCLWSPVKDSRGAKSWQIMESVKQNDLIIHLLKRNDGYYLSGVSIARSQLVELEDSPPKPGKWGNMSSYQRIDLDNFNPIDPEIHINSFFKKYEHDLKKIHEQFESGLFYVKYGKDETLRVSQRYLANCPNNLYQVFKEFFADLKFSPNLACNEKSIQTVNEPAYPDYASPGRVDSVISRIIRDTKLARVIKKNNNWRCIVCNKRIKLPSGDYYAEAHHLKPLGADHQGPDIEPNIIVLCPLHHTEFDYGSIAIDPNNHLIMHIDKDNKYNGKKLAYKLSRSSIEYINYHFEKIFNNH